jgi:hypothetical protein
MRERRCDETGVTMPKIAKWSMSWGALALMLTFAGSFPAAAAKVRCDHSHSAKAVCIQEFSAQARPRITIRPRYRRLSPDAKRYCRFWLATEYRLSGTVITPQQHCWWYVPRR